MLRESNLPHLHSRLKGLFQLDTQQDKHQPEDLCRLNILLTLLLMKSYGMRMQLVHQEGQKRLWKVRVATGNNVIERCGIGDLQPYDCFLSMFPHDHVRKIVQWSSKRLAEAGKRQKSIGEILRFFGVLVLCTRFEFGRRRQLWAAERTSKNISVPQFGAGIVLTTLRPMCGSAISLRNKENFLS